MRRIASRSCLAVAMTDFFLRWGRREGGGRRFCYYRKLMTRLLLSTLTISSAYLHCERSEAICSTTSNLNQYKGTFFSKNPSICLKRQKVKNRVLYLLSIKSIRFVNYLLWLGSSETLSLWRPLARRAFKTRRPFEVDILSRKPCLFFLFLFEGWNVLFISGKYFIYDFISLI